MNTFQSEALAVYADGDFDHPPPHIGDSLLSFILIELSDNEDCEDRETAIQRIESGIEDLNLVLEALQS